MNRIEEKPELSIHESHLPSCIKLSKVCKYTWELSGQVSFSPEKTNQLKSPKRVFLKEMAQRARIITAHASSWRVRWINSTFSSKMLFMSQGRKEAIFIFGIRTQRQMPNLLNPTRTDSQGMTSAESAQSIKQQKLRKMKFLGATEALLNLKASPWRSL